MRLWLMLLFSLLAFGCSKSKEGKPCPSDKTCGDGLLNCHECLSERLWRACRLWEGAHL